MKRKTIKYNYALYRILQHKFENTHFVPIYNPLKNTITVYDIDTKRIITTDFEDAINDFFEKGQDKKLRLSIEDLAQFITALPTYLQDKFKKHIVEEIEKCKAQEKQSNKK